VLEINLDDSQFRELAKELPEAHQAAATSVLRSVSSQLNVAYQGYARSTDFGPFAPLTVALRKGFGRTGKRGTMTRKGYGQWVGDFSRYFVDPDILLSLIGMLSKNEIDASQARFEPISRGFAMSAQKQAGGFDISIDRKRQRGIAKALMAQYGKDAEWIHKIIPSLGIHHVRARPVADPVYEQMRAAAIQTCMDLYKAKMAGFRYAGTAARNLLNIYSRGYA
jgi:hypothetical protein